MRAPITEAPADTCGFAGPKSGDHSAAAIFAASPSNSPRRMSSRFLRAGLADASSYRYTGTPNRSATAAPTFFASATHSSIVTPSMGTKGTTSTAPRRGCSP